MNAYVFTGFCGKRNKLFSREFYFSFIQKTSHLLLNTLTIFQVSYEYVVLIDSLHYARNLLTNFLHSEVNQLIQHIIVQDQGGQNNNISYEYLARKTVFVLRQNIR